MNVVELVRKVNPLAAISLERQRITRAEELNYWGGATNVRGAFLWAGTEQGFDYWEKIHSQIEKLENA